MWTCWASEGVLLPGSNMVLKKLVEVMSSSIVSTLTWQPVQDGTFVRLSLRRQIDSELHLTLQLSAANKHNTHSQYFTGVCVCVCVCAVGSDLTSHVRTPSGIHQHTCWRRAEWVPCLSCRHSYLSEDQYLDQTPAPRLISYTSYRSCNQRSITTCVWCCLTLNYIQYKHLFSWQNHELVRLLVCFWLTQTDWRVSR